MASFARLQAGFHGLEKAAMSEHPAIVGAPFSSVGGEQLPVALTVPILLPKAQRFLQLRVDKQINPSLVLKPNPARQMVGEGFKLMAPQGHLVSLVLRAPRGKLRAFQNATIHGTTRLGITAHLAIAGAQGVELDRNWKTAPIVGTTHGLRTNTTLDLRCLKSLDS